jgi:flavin-dependent dehydrogenase
MDNRTSVLVIGGGPGGATAAALLAREGIEVTLLERDHFPRYHIGESLLASCLPTLRLSGAFDEVAAQGFTVKRGALIHWNEDVWVLDWARLIGKEAWSWQVDRATYDDILLRNAAKQGATVIEGASVEEILFNGDRPYAARWRRDGEKASQTTSFDYIVDASGRAGVLAQQKLRLRRPHQIFQNIAVWSYWEGASLLPDSPEGGINVISCPEGWWWHIPLSGGRFSVGLVTHKDRYATDRRSLGSLEAYYRAKLASTPSLAAALSDATCVAEVKAEKDYSYVCEKFCGPGYFLVGDAACFLDPLLSTGVHLAQYSALIAAASILSIRRGEVKESEASDFYEYIYRRAYTRMLVLVSRLYEKYSGKDDYFWEAQRLVHEKTRQAQPVASLTDIISGLSDMTEASHSDLRLMNDELVAEAERAQDAKASAAPGGDLHSLDVTATWGPWRSLVGDDTTAGDLHLVTEPVLGLRRGKHPALAVA